MWNPIATEFAYIPNFNPKFINIASMNSNVLNTATILVSNKNHSFSLTNSSIILLKRRHLFVSSEGNIYNDDGTFNHDYPQWSMNQTECTSIFFDINNTIYCSMTEQNKVIKNSPTDVLPLSRLKQPHGIYVDIKLNVYIADSGNNRVLCFRQNEGKVETVAGNQSLGIYNLNFPTGVVVDMNYHLFIADCYNNRIIRSEGTGFRCIIGCHSHNNSLSVQLIRPYTLWFDKNGHIFVINEEKNRIQKFFLLSNNTTEVLHSVSSLHPLTCWNPEHFGFYCNSSNDVCSILQPCRNNGSCLNTKNDNPKFRCNCSQYFNGTYCEFNQRPCRLNYCSGHGICNTTTSNCLCDAGWTGDRCNEKIDYCHNISCHDHGICRSTSNGFICVCFSDNFYGTHCEHTSTKIVIKQFISKSFAYIAIIAMSSVALFVIIMDILKYVFGIDPVEPERQRLRQEKQMKKKCKPVIQRFIYVNTPATTTN